MKRITGKRLYVLAFFSSLVSMIIAGPLAEISSTLYYLPILAVAFVFAMFYYKADKPHMWSFLLLHLLAYCAYTAIALLAGEGSLAGLDANAAQIAYGILLLAALYSLTVMPVCLAYWAYKIAQRVKQLKATQHTSPPARRQQRRRPPR